MLLVLSDIILDDDFLDIDINSVLYYLNIGKGRYIDPFRTLKSNCKFYKKLIMDIYKENVF